MAATRDKQKSGGNARGKPGEKAGPVEVLRRLFMVEGVMIILLALALYLLLALNSYSPQDPGFQTTGESPVIGNTVGRSGAWLADVLLLLFGYLSYLFPLLLGYKALSIFRERKAAFALTWEILALRGAGLMMTLISASSLASLHFATELQGSAGGLLGQGIGSMAMPVLELVGSTLLFLTLLFLGLTLGLGISWLQVVDSAGALSLKLWERALEYRIRWLERQREKQETESLISQRKEALDHFVEKDRKRKPIAITPIREMPKEPSKRVQKEKQGRLFDVPAMGDLPPIGEPG